MINVEHSNTDIPYYGEETKRFFPDNRNIYDGNQPYIFISYSRANSDYVSRCIELMSPKIRLWYDAGLETETGHDWVEKIGQKIMFCEVFIAFISRKSNVSDFVLDEIQFARKFAKRIIAVFIEDVKVNVGLELTLCRHQYIAYKNYTPEEIVEKILAGIPGNVCIQPDNVKSEEYQVDNNSVQEKSEESEQEFNSLYEIVKKLGHGGSGEVFLIKSKRTGAEYILKKQSVGNRGKDDLITKRAITRNEVDKMLFLNNKPYTPVIIDYFETTDAGYLITLTSYIF